MTSEGPSRRAIGIAVASVVVLAIALRLPSCGESFWVDELHSAWTVSDSLGQVSGRAAAGNQTPLYFWGLWFWKQIFGDGEITLRLSSALAVAAGCGVLVVALVRVTGMLVAGVLAGAILAVESNSLFFGTELRPYAWVILLASVATAALVRLWAAPSRDDAGSAWAALVIACVLAMLVQPTSAGVLVWLPLGLLLRWRLRGGPGSLRFSRTDGILIAAVIAAAGLVWQSTLRQTWGERQIWEAFASAESFGQVLRIWPWFSLAVLPLGMTAAGCGAAFWFGGRDVRRTRFIGVTVALLAGAAAITLLYWTVARAEWLPVWHRRYFVAVLPLFAAGAGLSAASLCCGLAATRSAAARRGGVALAAACVIGALLWQQGIVARLTSFPRPLVHRGEDWRGAVAWVNARRQRAEPVYVDAGLIEARRFWSQRVTSEHEGGDFRLSEDQRAYLSYPLLGPYRIENSAAVQPVAPHLPPEALVSAEWSESDREHARARRAEAVFVISRRPAGALKTALNDAGAASDRLRLERAEYRGFGGVSAARVPIAPP